MNLSSAEFKERELKFRASPESLEAFMRLGESMGGRYVLGAGADVYWTNPQMPLAAPVRHRYSQGYGELTVKSQVQEGSNVSRHEVNVRLDDAQLREIEAMLPMMGYVPALKISKVSHIFYTDYLVLSWYSVMGMDGRMLAMSDGSPAQFVEIELREDLDWRTIGSRDTSKVVPEGTDRNKIFIQVEDFCHWVLDTWGAHLTQLSIVQQPAIKESLWEMFGGAARTLDRGCN